MKRLLTTTAACAALFAAALAAPGLARADALTITCPAAITVEADQFQAASVTPGTATATGDGVTITGPPAGVYPLGTTAVTYTATDSSGAKVSCNTTITVRDTTAPTIVCPAPITAEADQPGGATVNPGGATASDVANPVTVSGPSGAAFFPLGTTTLTYTATDASGNTSSCSTSITVVDTTPPTITCSAPITAVADQSGTAFVTPGGATAFDTAGPVTISGPAAAAYPIGTTTVTYTATDQSGNTSSCSTTITVVDTTPPTITCPAPITVEADQFQAAFVTPGSATATDNSGSVTISGPPAGSYPLGTTTVIYTATDASGNSSSCTTSIAVVDTTPPTIACPTNITVTAGAGGTALVTYTATASDIANPVTLSYGPASGSAFSIGTTTVTATATDAVGNSSSCTFTVTVKQALPTSTAQCKDGGWQAFGIFKNQGDCVSFVATRGRNAPG